MTPNSRQHTNQTPHFVIIYQPAAAHARRDENNRHSRPAAANSAGAAAPQFLTEALTLMEANLNNPQFTVEELSRKMGMSYSSLNRKLRRFTGQKAIQLLRDMRLQRAQALLRRSTLSVSEVAYETGFTSPAYFSRIFSREMGAPPSEYRKANLPDPQPMRAVIGCTEFSPG